jgi:Putative beta-barrel porin-2, OmpL-like. bbp2
MNITKFAGLTSVASLALAVAGAARAEDQPAPAAPAGPTALSTPAMSASLSANANPISVDTGPLGKIYFSGQITGLGTWQDHAVLGNNSRGKADFSNAQLEVQKTDGVVQFYVQAGTYNFPSLGSAYVSSGRLTQDTFMYVPVAFLKIVPNASFNVMIGKLPTLIGAEYTFTFENLNIARGLLWNQEPAISRGVQVNYTQGPLTVSGSLNDGYYSSRYTTASGLVSYVLNPKDTVAFAASGNFDKTSISRFVTPVAQNNGSIYNLIWTHTDGAWVINPYLQYSTTPKDTSLGLPGSASTFGGAVLVKYAFNPMFNLAGRAEYISSSGSQVSLLYGPKSKAWSLTLTPTWQLKTFFIRGELSYTKLDSAAPGAGFGKLGDKDDQTRAMIETGVLF